MSEKKEKINAIVLTNNNFEDICQNEIKDLIKITESKISTSNSIVKFTCTENEILKIAYKSQSIKKAIILLSEFEFSSLKDIELQSKSITLNYSKYILENENFAVRCEKITDLKFNSTEIEKAVASSIKGTVNLNNPNIVFSVIIVENKCYIGVDVSGIDLSKRYYKIFSHPNSIKGTLAYFLICRAGYDNKKILLDPMSGSGTIVIEAAHKLSNLSINYYRKNEFQFMKMKYFSEITDEFFEKEDSIINPPKKKISLFSYDNQLSCVNAIKKNSKISGVENYISQGRGEVDWIDTKFEPKSVDLVVSNPPMWNKLKEKENKKLFEQFFHRVKKILKISSKIILLTNNYEDIDSIAEQSNFERKTQWKFNVGKTEMFIVEYKLKESNKQ